MENLPVFIVEKRKEKESQGEESKWRIRWES